jgi:hypothetical protein
MLVPMLIFAQLIKTPTLKAPGVKWEKNYVFDKVNSMKVDFYDKAGKLRQTLNYKTYYQSKGNDFCVKMTGERSGIETVFDMKNEVAIQAWTGTNTEPYYNAGRFFITDESEKKMLQITATGETKDILGFRCDGYTYAYKKITGKVWICKDINLSNDYGIFRAAKMAALHNTLSVGGFVMEMTTEDAKGGKTIMQTVSLRDSQKYNVSYEGVEMGTALNKVSYFAF